jgi:folate-dependent tRNA-U54 methylase TrmFO/GidA
VKCCQQYALPEYAANVILLDTGHAKLMSPYYPLEDLRRIPGLEDARYEDPYAGGMGNSVRFLALSSREDTMQVIGPMGNLFCGGEKAGLLVGHTEAIVTGTLAGHNAVRHAAGVPLLSLPTDTAVGDFIAYSGEAMKTDEGKMKKYTFSGSVYFDRMQALDLYTTEVQAIQQRVANAGAAHIFEQPISDIVRFGTDTLTYA